MALCSKQAHGAQLCFELSIRNVVRIKGTSYDNPKLYDLRTYTSVSDVL